MRSTEIDEDTGEEVTRHEAREEEVPEVLAREKRWVEAARTLDLFRRQVALADARTQGVERRREKVGALCEKLAKSLIGTTRVMCASTFCLLPADSNRPTDCPTTTHGSLDPHT
jgi:hypothetical protein